MPLDPLGENGCVRRAVGDTRQRDPLTNLGVVAQKPGDAGQVVAAELPLKSMVFPFACW